MKKCWVEKESMEKKKLYSREKNITTEIDRR